MCDGGVDAQSISKGLGSLGGDAVPLKAMENIKIENQVSGRKPMSEVNRGGGASLGKKGKALHSHDFTRVFIPRRQT